MIYAWDEISCETQILDEAHPLDCTVDEPAFRGWEMEHVIDLPNETRLVIEKSDRGHLAVLVTTPEEEAPQQEQPQCGVANRSISECKPPIVTSHGIGRCGICGRKV